MGHTWDDLRAADEAEQARRAAEKVATALERMYLRHGKADGQRCGDCRDLVKLVGDMQITPFKCREYGITHSAASDWRLKWPACGKFEQRESEG